MDRRLAARLGTLGAALALSACMMPYDGMYEAPPVPAWSAVESPDSYAYIDRADALWEAIGDAPPDHAFPFEDAEPWAWDLADGHRIVVEETGDGIRSFYFAPGDDGPFLAVRPGMSFGFERDTVAVVYGPDGGAMPRDAGSEHLGEGAEMYARGRLLLRAMQQRQWRDVDSQAWIDTGPMIWGSVALWDSGMNRYPGWRRHRDTARDADWRHRLTAERLRRQALAEQFRRWREGGFQGPPPGRWHKPGDRPRPGAGGPGRPGRPGIDPPRQPGQGGRPPGWQPGPPRGPDAGVPGRPGWQGDRPPRPEAGTPGRPRPGRPDAMTPGTPRPGWQGGRPPRPDAGTPGRPRPGGWQGGRPLPAEVAPSPTTERPSTAPAPAAPSRRPSWRSRPERADAAAGEPVRPQIPPMTDRPRPPRPEGGRPGWFRPRPDAGSAPASPPPAARSPRGDGGGWSRPVRSTPMPAPAPPRSSSPPPAAPRVAPPPRPAPPNTPREDRAREPA